MHVDICVATYKRPAQLKQLLESLLQLSETSDLTKKIIIVDNDQDGSAKDTVAQFRIANALDITYSIEPTKGVSHARNRALELANSEYICFVDDDQVVHKDWLTNLLASAVEYGADVVFGPVLSQLPAGCPPWILKSGLFNRRRSATGTPRSTGGTGNVLMTRDILERAQRGFDPAYGLTGGEDTEFFLFLGSLGAKMIWCDEALAWEMIPESRATFAWLLKRNYNAGKTYGRICFPRLGTAARISSFIKSLFGSLVLGATSVLALPLGKHHAAPLVMIAARNIGRMAALAKRPGRTTATRA